MKFDNMLPYRAVGLSVTLLGFATRANGLTQTYCSSENTADASTFVSNDYQSNGACYDTCKASYAFAVVQYKSCWCSNYIPADTTDTGSCNQDCPGYPFEQCGNTDSGLYGYVALPNSPSGTAGGSSPSSTTPSQQSSSQQQSTTTEEPTSTTAPQTSFTSQTSTTSPSTTSTKTTTTDTPVAVVPVTSVIRTVISGAVVTQTVTSTPVAAGAGGAQQQPENLNLHRKSGLGGGAIAGIVIGVLAALALVGVGAFLLWRRKRKPDGEESGAGNSKNLGRNVSVLSKAGLLARTRPSMGERDHEETYNSATGQNSVRHSMMFGPGAAEGVSPVSPLGSSDGSNHSRRMSKPMVYDQRLNPSALFANQEANGSRISMQDTQDYSRPLGVMNPDPRPSFESRVSHV